MVSVDLIDKSKMTKLLVFGHNTDHEGDFSLEIKTKTKFNKQTERNNLHEKFSMAFISKEKEQVGGQSTERSVTKRSQIMSNNKQGNESHFDVSIDQITINNFEPKQEVGLQIESCSSFNSLSGFRPKPMASDLDEQMFL